MTPGPFTPPPRHGELVRVHWCSPFTGYRGHGEAITPEVGHAAIAEARKEYPDWQHEIYPAHSLSERIRQRDARNEARL